MVALCFALQKKARREGSEGREGLREGREGEKGVKRGERRQIAGYTCMATQTIFLVHCPLRYSKVHKAREIFFKQVSPRPLKTSNGEDEKLGKALHAA